MSRPKALVIMADYGHDPSETAVPFTAITEAGFEVQFATEDGKVPACDRKMLEGMTQKLLGAKSSVVQKYAAMATTQAFLHPLAWTKPGFTLDDYALILFPGGHDKGIRQMIDSPIVHRLIIDYFPKTKKPGKKAVAAICHGVMALSNAKDVKSGRSPISTCATTALPGFMESFIYQSTRLFLGDCYKTYGAGSENVEQSVRKILDDEGTQWKGSTSMSAPFVIEDENYNYISARWPGDADLFGEKLVNVLRSFDS